MLVNVNLSQSCFGVENVLLCQEMPTVFPPGISNLAFSMNGVGEINSTVLRSENLTSVTHLQIEKSGITGIAEGAFSSFENLTNLNLNKNLLTEINPKWLGGPHILRDLSLAGNQIEALNESMLHGLDSLVRLSLNKNKIRTIHQNTFSSNSVLAELDLSGNRMTWVSPQVFQSLRSTRVRLDGNPWNCSCGVGDFVDFLKDLQNRSLLDRPMDVTCESPPSLRGQRVWNVSVCVMPPPPPTAPVTPTFKPSTILTSGPTSTSANVVTISPSQTPSETLTSLQPKPTDAPTLMSSHTASHPPRHPSETHTSVQPTTVASTTLKSDSFTTRVTSTTSVTEFYVHPKPSEPSTMTPTPTSTTTHTCVTPQPTTATNMVCTLFGVIVVLVLLLFALCFLIVLHRRKRSNKSVMPISPEENRDELREDSRSQSPGHSEKTEISRWDSETGWRRSFTGVRAKSANAILFVSPFCTPGKDQVTLQTEAQTTDTENQAEVKPKQGEHTGVDGESETENPTNETNVIKDAKQANAVVNLDETLHCVSIHTGTVPYLSIGTVQNKPTSEDFNKQDTDAGQRSQRVIGRISTWPPTASQWQARCKMKEEEGSEEFTDWTLKCSGEVVKGLKKEQHPFASDQDKQEGETEKNQDDPLEMTVAHMTSQALKQNDETLSLSEDHSHADRLEEQLKQQEEGIQDVANLTQNLNQNLNQAPNQDQKSAGNAESKSSKTRSEASRQRVMKAPSGGASPDDETLLSGNQYAFMDLLHEVSQNHGRTTRDRWRQIHVTKQRQRGRGAEDEHVPDIK
ncbi:hypothetical protein JOQ06_012432 [Pogonophryne albipinna]|uniref:LRRCT domain-containing protein n=1 Tax=Pogonophryne albipinna TaxID=1090488 RepID=A0AAD6FP51_9TELE|nr:hypothetical protein JOQ06_012432 [Pogonophryne albipinna]